MDLMWDPPFFFLGGCGVEVMTCGLGLIGTVAGRLANGAAGGFEMGAPLGIILTVGET
jgi:hypothetical protein